MSIRVAVVDDQALVRGGFAMVLAHQQDIEVVSECGTGLEAIDAAQIHRPDVILMDIRMPEMDGLALLAELRKSPATQRIGFILPGNTPKNGIISSKSVWQRGMRKPY